MNFGFLTTPLAYMNYRKKLDAYNEAQVRYKQLKSIAEDAVDEYQDTKMELEDQIIGRDEEGNYEQYDNVPDLKVSPLLQIGDLSKNKIKMNAIVLVQNLSTTKEYYINKNLLVQFCLSGYKSKFLAGYNMDGIGTQWREPIKSGVEVAFKGQYYKIAPGGFIQFETKGSPTGFEYFTKTEMEQIRKDICLSAGVSRVGKLPVFGMIDNINLGKRLFVETSMDDDNLNVKTNFVEDVPLIACNWETSRAYISGNAVVQTRFMAKNADCKLQYMGEGWVPNLSGLIDLLFG